MEVNPDHYKYMPHTGEEPPVPQPEQEPEEKAEQEATTAVAGEITAPTVEPVSRDIRTQTDEEESDKDYSFPFLEGTLPRLLYNLCSPLIVPTFATLFIFFFSLLAVVAPGAVLPYGLTVFGATCLIPAIAMYVLLKIGAIQSFQLYDKSERLIPYVVEFLALGGTTLFFIFKGASAWIWTIYCGGALATVVNFLINFRIRISCHCTAIAGLLASLIVLQNHGVPQVSLLWWVIGTVGFAGVAGMVAIIQRRHTILEVLAGYATGFLSVLLLSLIH